MGDISLLIWSYRRRYSKLELYSVIWFLTTEKCAVLEIHDESLVQVYGEGCIPFNPFVSRKENLKWDEQKLMLCREEVGRVTAHQHSETCSSYGICWRKTVGCMIIITELWLQFQLPDCSRASVNHIVMIFSVFKEYLHKNAKRSGLEQRFIFWHCTLSFLNQIVTGDEMWVHLLYAIGERSFQGKTRS